jgi:hypothetical protein
MAAAPSLRQLYEVEFQEKLTLLLLRRPELRPGRDEEFQRLSYDRIGEPR